MVEDDRQIVAWSSELWEKSHDIEALLHSLRERGVSKLDSIKLVRQICHVPLGEAKRIVVQSLAWGDTLQATIDLHEAIAAEAKIERI